jgi:hypothetical protein
MEGIIKLVKIKIVISFLLICSNSTVFGRHKPIEHEYLDSVVNTFIDHLQKRSVRNYIVYTETRKEFIISEDIQSDKTICIFWKENNTTYLKKLSNHFGEDYMCLEYDSLEIATDTVFKLSMMYRKDLISQGNTVKEEVDGLYYNYFPEDDLTITEVSVVEGNDKLFFYDYSSPPDEYYARAHLINSIRKLISSYAPALEIKSKSKPDFSFIARYQARAKTDDLKEKQYKDQVLSNLINSSIPLTDSEFIQLPKLEQEVYLLYEYLLNKDSFINDEAINFKTKYFLVPTMTIGTYSRGKSKHLTDMDFVAENKKTLTVFKPRCNPQKAEKYLYMNSEVAQYYSKYDEYGCLPGIYHSDARLMSGYLFFIESPPAIRQILFSKSFNEAYVCYDYKTETYFCQIKKKGNDWKLFGTIEIITHD